MYYNMSLLTDAEFSAEFKQMLKDICDLTAKAYKNRYGQKDDG